MKKTISLIVVITILISLFPSVIFADEPEAEKLKYEFYRLPTYTDGAWTFLSAPQNRELVSEEKIESVAVNSADDTWSYTWADGSWAFCGAPEQKTKFVRVRPCLDLNGYRFTAPKDGNFRYTIEGRNVGEAATGMFGGDGVTAKWQVLSPSDNIDLTWLDKIELPRSQANPPTIKDTGVVSLKAGDSFTLWLYHNQEPSWDVLELMFTLEETDEEGKTWTNLEYEPLLPRAPEEQKVKAAPFREGLFWINRLSDGEPAQLQEAYDLWSKYMPQRFGVMTENNVNKNTNSEEMAKFYSDRNIPSFHRTMGNWDTHRYFEVYDAIEINWTEEPKSTLLPFHDTAKPHEAFTHVFDVYSEASMKSGWGGAGTIDYIWDWSQERGRTGFHPVTIAQYRKDLKHEDEGLRISMYGGEVETIHFWDYCKYYTGVVLEPEDLGFNSWDEYAPYTKQEYLKNPTENYSHKDVIHDLLAHYEHMRIAQHLGATAKELGGEFQTLINPEDMANGTDLLFLGALVDNTFITDEYFNSSHLIDGVYYHYSYLHDFEGNAKRIGAVLEGGQSGQLESYWDQELCYAMSYEATTAGELTHMEGDYWPGLYDIETMKNHVGTDLEWQTRRAQDMFSFARGFADASDDKLEKFSPDFLSVTSRRILRPWGLEYDPVWGTGNWAYHPRWEYTPEHVLAKKGYIFRGIGEDGVERYLNEHRKVVSYSPDRPVRAKFDFVLDRLNDGTVENIITPAGSLREIMDYDLKMKPIGEVYPEFAGTPGTHKVSGDLKLANGETVAADIADAEMELYTMNDTGLKPVMYVGGTPVVLEKNHGKGKIYIVLFDTWRPETYELTGAVYKYLLGLYGVNPHWETLEVHGENIDPNISMTNNMKRDLEAFETEASVRMYSNEEGLTVVAIQNPFGRSFWDAPGNASGHETPYNFKGITRVNVVLEPNKEYTYVAMPSGVRGSGKTNADGELELSFENTTHELFFVLPESPENVTKLSKIMRRRHIYYDALSLDGRLDVPDTTAPITVPSVDGNMVRLTAEDNQCGDGIKYLEYSVNGKNWIKVYNRSSINEGTITKSISLNKGENTIRFRATDNAGNVESEGEITVNSGSASAPRFSVNYLDSGIVVSGETAESNEQVLLFVTESDGKLFHVDQIESVEGQYTFEFAAPPKNGYTVRVGGWFTDRPLSTDKKPTEQSNTIYVSGSGSDTADGSKSAPVATLYRAEELADTGDVIEILDIAHMPAGFGNSEKTLTLTGGILDFTNIMDFNAAGNLVFKDINMNVNNLQNFFANGHTMVFDSGVTTQGEDYRINLYGGSADSDVEKTDLIIRSGRFESVFGGNMEGDVAFDTSVSFEGGYIHTNLCGGNERGTLTGDSHIVMTGGHTETVIGGSENGNIIGNTYVTVTGGEVSRRIFGGCFNEYTIDSGWRSYNSVSGTTNITVGGSPVLCESALPEHSDKGIYGGSRCGTTDNEDENNTVIFLDDCFNIFKDTVSTEAEGNPACQNIDYMVVAGKGGTVAPTGEAGVLSVYSDAGYMASVNGGKAFKSGVADITGENTPVPTVVTFSADYAINYLSVSANNGFVKVDANITAKNLFDEQKQPAVFIAALFCDGLLSGVKSQNIPLTGTADYSLQIPCSYEPGHTYTVKAMLWDGTGALLPLISAVEEIVK